MIDGGLRKLFHTNLPGHWQAVESALTGGGIPDSNFCMCGVEGWVEYKITKTNSIRFRPGQVPWIHRRVRNGGTVWIAVRHKHDGGPRKGPPVDDLYLYSGQCILELNEKGLTLEPALKTWDWEEIKLLLQSAS